MFCGLCQMTSVSWRISKAIQKELYNFWELFTVITLEEYPDYIKGGILNEPEESR